jgi:2-polyprenyl-3-methyl-5-hydroxy-6-metoxy-1,4-benzoquinol methylase
MQSGSTVNISILASSKGAEVYSIVWFLRSAHPGINLKVHAIDISQDILEFASQGIYSRHPTESYRDQNASIFERMSNDEMAAMFEMESDQARIRPWIKAGITWLVADAGDRDLKRILGPQDIVVANRFLCHMDPKAAESCLYNIARLVRPGGFLFVSGVDLDVRTKVASQLQWRPVVDLLKEVHDGDCSLRRGWPLEYWGLEPCREQEPGREYRYASIFQIGERFATETARPASAVGPLIQSQHS